MKDKGTMETKKESAKNKRQKNKRGRKKDTKENKDRGGHETVGK